MERRSYGRRVSVDLEASVQSGARRLKARVVDLGTGGMAIETDAGIDLERFLRIQIRVSPGSPTLDVDAIVRRREKRASSTRWGLELVEPSPSSLALIESCLDRLGAANQEPAPDADKASAGKAAAALRAAQDADLRGLFESALRSLE